MRSQKRKYELRTNIALYRMGAGSRATTYKVIYLSDALERTIRFERGSRVRIEGELQDEFVSRAFLPIKGANHYMIVSNDLLGRIGCSVGDSVTLRFDIVSSTRVHVPDELKSALSEDEDAQAEWERLTPGRKRTWTAHVDRAKRPETRAARTEEVIDRLRRGLTDPRDLWPAVD